MCTSFFFYESIFKTSSNRLVIIGTDIETISIFVPSSILLAIALSPESLQILTANSDKNAIPVIFINNAINFVLTADLLAIELIKDITPCQLVHN